MNAMIRHPALSSYGANETSFLDDPTYRMVYGVLTTASMALSAYHGYKRNNSIGWALWWGFAGTVFPVFTPVIAVAQGYAEPAR